MDPFTEKLLERTRARRENLQKKMAARPNAAERQLVKRPREPLTDTNGVVIKTVVAEVTQTSLKPSPSKRRCSTENTEPVETEKSQTQPPAPVRPDPLTDKKPPVVPVSVPPTSSTGEARPVELKTLLPASEKIAAAAPSKMQTSGVVDVAMKSVEDPVEGSPAAAAVTTDMKSRLQRLAQQRKCWDGIDESAENATPPRPLRENVATSSGPAAVPSETSVGRRGKLAVLAATIGTWEDDLSHVSISKEKKSVAAFTPKSACRNAHLSASTSSSNEPRPRKAFIQAVAAAPLESREKTESPASVATPNSVTRPRKAAESPSSSLKSAAVANVFTPPLSAKATFAKNTAASPGPKGVQVKSFLDRFGERCQERTNSPTGRSTQPATPNSRLVQNRFMAAQAAQTTTADLAHKQKLERESELAQIRSRPQGNNLWKSRDAAGSESKKSADLKESLDKCVDSNMALFEQKDEPKAPFPEATKSPVKGATLGCGFLNCPPASASSPMRNEDKTADASKDEENAEDGEIELCVDGSVDSAVINDLFQGVLEEQDQEAEDALNISSMSLLTPLAETVAAAVVKSPETMMTSTPAGSFIMNNSSLDEACQPPFQRASIRSATSDSIHVTDDNPKLPYSVDAYRSTRVKESEKADAKGKTAKKELSHRAEELGGASLSSVKQKLKILTNEMNLQQTIIHQASQALNCCTDEEHGKGSQVEAEAERLLLVATEKREALKTELQHLKGEKRTPAASKATGISASKGSVCLQDLRLPLKADFVCSSANKPESTKHSFFILIRAGAENTVATPLASTHCGLTGDTLTFPTKLTLSDVSSEFAIDIQVYCLIQKCEISSDKKKKASKSKAITPKRFLAITKSSQTPVLASPGGPSAVRTSNFVLVGHHKLTLSSIGENKFHLEKVPFLCPLEGHVYLRMLCQVNSKVEERGFLTMFEDVSGFGAWRRRWCVLSGYCISYWTYPDDEKKKNPIGRINLAKCISNRVEAAKREFCARPNTLELVTVRAQREDDKETLVSQCSDSMCVTKNWLSADTKDERNLWLHKLNQILVDLRLWQPGDSSKPL
ncbi:anillin [Syngnathus scovelli]|uniref:anillin n=1 Tax=Syngnathus scovelli TaxID=161590 RepID=UPI00210F6ED1|nr:anillin [Syngnathus scovelli]